MSYDEFYMLPMSKYLENVDDSITIKRRKDILWNSFDSLKDSIENNRTLLFQDSIAFVTNVTSCILFDDDYYFDEDNYLLENCNASILFDKIDSAFMDKKVDNILEIIKKECLKREMYELITNIDYYAEKN